MVQFFHDFVLTTQIFLPVHELRKTVDRDRRPNLRDEGLDQNEEDFQAVFKLTHIISFKDKRLHLVSWSETAAHFSEYDTD